MDIPGFWLLCRDLIQYTSGAPALEIAGEHNPKSSLTTHSIGRVHMNRRQGILRSAARLLAILTVGALTLPLPPTVHAETIISYPLPSTSFPEGITAGPDGALWFTESLGNK